MFRFCFAFFFLSYKNTQPFFAIKHCEQESSPFLLSLTCVSWGATELCASFFSFCCFLKQVCTTVLLWMWTLLHWLLCFEDQVFIRRSCLGRLWIQDLAGLWGWVLKVLYNLAASSLCFLLIVCSGMWQAASSSSPRDQEPGQSYILPHEPIEMLPLFRCCCQTVGDRDERLRNTHTF